MYNNYAICLRKPVTRYPEEQGEYYFTPGKIYETSDASAKTGYWASYDLIDDNGDEIIIEDCEINAIDSFIFVLHTRKSKEEILEIFKDEIEK